MSGCRAVLAATLAAVLVMLAATPAHARTSAMPNPRDTSNREGEYGLDISQPLTVSNAKCMKNLGFDFISIRAFRSYDAPDPNALTSFANAVEAGFQEIDIYLFPCIDFKHLDTQHLVEQSLQPFIDANNPDLLPDRVWLDIELNPKTRCNWRKDLNSKAEQCDYVRTFVERVQFSGFLVGIYTTKNFWTQYFGPECNDIDSFFYDTYNEGDDVALWYAHAGTAADYSDYNRHDERYEVPPWPSSKQWPPADGYQPYRKQYWFDQTVCKTGADLDWQMGENLQLASLPLTEIGVGMAGIASAGGVWMYQKRQAEKAREEKRAAKRAARAQRRAANGSSGSAKAETPSVRSKRSQRSQRSRASAGKASTGSRARV